MKCGPDDCPILGYETLSPAAKKAERKAKAHAMYREGFTQEQIAMLFGVSQSTIRDDLADLVVPTKSNRTRTASNPKGAGRPKGSTKPRGGPKPERRTTTPAKEQHAASLVLDHGKTYEQAKAELDLKSVQPVKTAVAAELARREPRVERSDLSSMTAQEKFDAAIRAEKRRLENAFEARVLEECRHRLNSLSLPSYTKQLEELERSIKNRKGVMDGVTYKKILACLHPDRLIGLLASTADERPRLLRRYEEAFRLFTELEKRVLDEKESPTQFRRDIPRTYEELMAAREKVRAANRERAMRARPKAGVSVP
jgi:transcriptional regulator with XRE-family HTH domain